MAASGNSRLGPAKSRSLDARLVHQKLAESLFGADFSPPTLGPYHLVRRIGAGGSGFVFEGRDSRSGQRLALKVLRERGREALLSLKREFRALADVRHPNLVQLYELSIEGEDPFIAMELVDGDWLFDALRTDGMLKLERFEPVFRQLVDAVSALHAAGKLHLDVKPSNLLVCSDGRLVVLDFGLVRAAGERAEGAGTPLYMAPERLLGQAATAASDWFSAGVVLQEALRRIGAPASEVPDDADPNPALSRANRIAELRALCSRMRDAEPGRRPRSDELRALFGLPPLEGTAIGTSERPRTNSLFMGREAELERLRTAFDVASRGECAVIYLHGEPGIGKSALAKRFLEQLGPTPSAVLAGRCHEHELIPYNAADGVVDALARHLLQLAPEHPARALGAGTSELARLFPALHAALPDQDAERSSAAHADPHRLRERAVAALRAMLAALASDGPVVIHLDDLQWGDADSAELLLEVLRPPALGSLLLLASYRTADRASSPCVRALQQDWPTDRAGVHVLELGPLPEAPALTMARELSQGRLSDGTLASLTREAAGSPLFLRALVLYETRVAAAATIPSHASNFQQLIKAALHELPGPVRELLAMTALVGQPIDRGLLLRAAGLLRPAETWVNHLSELHQSGLVRRGAHGTLESYHDRVRTAVVEATAAEECKRFHATLAEAETLSQTPDPEFLARRYLGAGEHAHAARYAELAGDRAFAALALERAAELFALALDNLDGKRPGELLEKLANATAFSGRCEQAAPLYLEAAEQQREQERALRLRLRAAEMLLRAGRFDASTEVAKPVLKAVGLRYPKTIAGVGLLVIRSAALIELQLRRYGIDSVTPRRTPTRFEALRSEVCFSLGYRLGISDPARSCALLVRSFELALATGTDFQLARGLASYALMLATLGLSSPERQMQLLERARQLACETRDPDAQGWVLFFHVLTVYARGDFRDTLLWIAKAREWIATNCIDVGWLLQELDVGECAQLYLVGDLIKLQERSDAALIRMRQTGSTYESDNITLHRSFLCFAADQGESVLSQADQILGKFSAAEGRIVVAAIAIWIKAHAFLFLGRGGAARELLRERGFIFADGGYERVQPWSAALPWIRGTAALAAAIEYGSGDRGPLKQAISRLRKQRSPFASGLLVLLEAGQARLEGRIAKSAELYGLAADRFESLSMLGYASAARVRQAELVDPRAAGPLRARANAWFESQRIVNRGSWVRMYAP